MYLSELGVICALGGGKVLGFTRMAGNEVGAAVDWLDSRIPAISVPADLPSLPSLQRYNCRNNRMLLAALMQIESAVLAVY